MSFFHYIGINDLIDVLLVAALLYYFYRLMKDSGSLKVFMGVIVFVFIWLVLSQVLQMKLIGSIIDKLMDVGILALLIIFQNEIRHFLLSLGRQQHARNFLRFFTSQSNKKKDNSWVIPIVMACSSMSRGKVGALIVMEGSESLSEVVETGDVIDAEITQRLIENIFFKNSPLHDGAMVISHRRIKAAGCILPVSHDQDIPKHLGLRHRAALGISQDSDALSVIVSEETGAISVAKGGEIFLDLNPESLERYLTQED